jgi:hypothetical protein
MKRCARRWFVDDGPEGPQLAHGIDKRTEVDWFNYVGVHTELVAADKILFFT